MPDLHRELCPGLVPLLRCPVCGAALRITENGAGLACTGDRPPQGRIHCFDGAASGYVPLAPRHPGGGDAKDAVRARTAFLTHGYYAPAAEAITHTVMDYTPAGGTVLDAGCGEGYYSGHLSRAGFSVMGVDLSKFAVEAAAKTARADRLTTGQNQSSTLFSVGSVFELPVHDAAFDTVVNIFAPCAPEEYARVLRPGGHLVVVGAGERHLFGLKELLYDDPYLNDPRRDLPAEGNGWSLVETRSADFEMTVTEPAHIAALFSMTPYYWRTPRDSRARLAACESLVTEVCFDIHVFQKD